MAVAGVAVLVWAAGPVQAVVVLASLTAFGALLNTLLREPTPRKRFWAALLQPNTLLLLFMPRKISRDIEALRKREDRP